MAVGLHLVSWLEVMATNKTQIELQASKNDDRMSTGDFKLKYENRIITIFVPVAALKIFKYILWVK